MIGEVQDRAYAVNRPSAFDCGKRVVARCTAWRSYSPRVAA
jgi:hypothetical protein